MTKTLIVGIGSPHGDDRAGWIAIEQLQTLRFNFASLQKASVPHDVLDWLDGVDSLQIIDSYRSEQTDLNLQRFELQPTMASGDAQHRWILSGDDRPSTVLTMERPARFRSAGSHQIDVLTVLQLAACLKQLPRNVILWGIPGQRFKPGDSISSNCETAIQECVTEIMKEFRDA